MAAGQTAVVPGSLNSECEQGAHDKESYLSVNLPWISKGEKYNNDDELLLYIVYNSYDVSQLSSGIGDNSMSSIQK